MSARQPWWVAFFLAGVGAAALVTGASAADAPGDAASGHAVFQDRGCVRCHRPRGEEPGQGPALEAVRRPQGALELAGRMWNHAPAMFGAVEQEGLRWPDLTREQMGHLMVYLQAEPTRDPEPDPRRGQAVLVRKGCLKCHQLRGEGGSVAIDLGQARAGFESAVAWATMVWNHAPRMAQHAARLGVLYPRFAGDEMSQLVLFLRSVSASR